MGMFDTVHAELDCPFCSRQYRHTPLTRAQAEQEVKKYKQLQIQSRQEYLRDERKFYLQDYWARQDGFEDIDAWIEQLDTSDKVEAQRIERTLGLVEIQTKEFQNHLDHFFVGDEVPKYWGHYFIAEEFKCEGCSAKDERVYVKVWLEIENRKLKAVLTLNPETGKAEREAYKDMPAEPRQPDPHPRLHFKYRNLQAQAKWDDETAKYDMEVHYLPEHYMFSHENEELLRTIFEDFANDYLYLIGKGGDDKPSLHEHLHSVCRHLPSDFEPYGERERDGADCSCGCRHFLKLPGKSGMDWGVCANTNSPRAGLLTFEHQGCEQFEE